MLWVILILVVLVVALLVLVLIAGGDIQDQLSLLNQSLSQVAEPPRPRGVPDLKAMAEARAQAHRRGPGAPTQLPSLDGKE